ncbi:MAG: cbb3-type cytochrome c oxidase subunit II [Opitutales bacterium]|jgi:cbb3-type cytochrome c oxidase subunit II
MRLDRVLTGSACLGLVAAAFFSVFCGRIGSAGPAPETVVDRGRAVYIAEGCIHCHSQYVRPVGPDQELWGPSTRPETALGQGSVLIGNRRQGPDLANVGMRRTPEWNRRHLIDPPSISRGSRMPSYRHLFSRGNPDGEALLVYLQQLHPPVEEIVEQSDSGTYP